MRALIASASAAAVAALLLPAATAGAGSDPKAQASGEELVIYLTEGKLDVGNDISFQVSCGADCALTSAIEFVLPGPNLNLPQLAGTFPAFLTVDVIVELNSQAKKAIKSNIKKVKLRSDITATNIVTGEVDTDSKTYKLKR